MNYLNFIYTRHIFYFINTFNGRNFPLWLLEIPNSGCL